MKTIGININDIIRTFLGKFHFLYSQAHPDKLIELEVIDLFKLDEHFLTEQDAIDFIYSETVFELFACADEMYKNCVNDLNVIQQIMKEEGFELILLSDEFGKTIPATLQFLAKTGCQIQKITFIEKDQSYFDYCDILVTTNPKYFSDKTIKVLRPYNEKHINELVIKEINDLPKLLDKLELI